MAEDLPDDYSSDLHRPDWLSLGEGCDARERTLHSAGHAVLRGKGCAALAGEWVSVYDSEDTCPEAGGSWRHAEPGRTGDCVIHVNQGDDGVNGKLDVEHVVPLAEAWRSGARSWPAEKFRQFASDQQHLLVVSARSNRQKGDQDVAHWQPENPAYRCAYLALWRETKQRWDLSADPTERDAITQLEATCTPPEAAITKGRS